jgi:diacylglycerol O-acyltransferase / wax synthase
MPALAVWLHAEIAEPVERLRASRASAKGTKEHFAATKDTDISKIVEIVPGPLVSALVWADEKTKGRYSPFKNVAVSNVAGPRRPLYLGQWKLDQWFSTGQVAYGGALNFTVWSYVDQFNLAALADAEVIPDAWPLIAGFRASLDELLTTAEVRPNRNHSPAPSTPPS